MTTFRYATIDEFLAGCALRARFLAEAARKRIVSAVDAIERLRPGWGLLGYNAPAYFAFIVPGQDDVRIGFEWGVRLKDPERLLSGAGSQVRYVTIRAVKDLKAPGLTVLLREAAALRCPSRSPARRGAR